MKLTDLSGIDHDAIAEDITWIPLAPDSDHISWELTLESVVHKESGTAQDVGVRILIDSGSTPLQLPKEALDPIMLQIPGAVDNQRGQYEVPCDTKDSLGLRFGGKVFWVLARDWVGKPTGAGRCLTQLIYIDPLDPSPGTGIVGDVFFHSLYSAYRLEPPAVGFAPYKS